MRSPDKPTTKSLLSLSRRQSRRPWQKQDEMGPPGKSADRRKNDRHDRYDSSPPRGEPIPVRAIQQLLVCSSVCLRSILIGFGREWASEV